MIRGQMIDEYRRLNSGDRGAFQSWLIANTVVGAFAFFAVIAVITLVHSSDGATTATVQKEKVTVAR